MTQYGFYSPSAAQEYGTLLYETVTGEIVHVTVVTNDPEGATYLWQDKVSLGEVVRFVGEGRKGTNKEGPMTSFLETMGRQSDSILTSKTGGSF